MQGTNSIRFKLVYAEKYIPLKRNTIGTGELGYDGPLYDGFSHMTDDMLGPSPMHI